MKQKMMLVLWLVAMQYAAQSQQVLGAAGTVGTGGGITLYYTVGETAIAQRVSTNTRVHEGFWQNVDAAVAVVDISGIQRDIRVFPNPTSDRFTVDLGEGFPVELRCTLLNTLGVAVEITTLERDQSSVLMGDPGLESGLYLLLVQTPDGRTAHTFQVLKM